MPKISYLISEWFVSRICGTFTLLVILSLMPLSIRADDNLLSATLSGIENASIILNKVSYEMEGSVQSEPHRESTFAFKARVVREHFSRCGEYSVVKSMQTTGAMLNPVFRTVVNERFAAWWLVGTGSASQLDYDDVRNPPDKTARMIDAVEPPDLKLIVYGNGVQTLPELAKSFNGKALFKAERTAKGNIVIREFTKRISDASQPTFVYTIDPNRGFAMVDLIARDGANSVVVHKSVELSQVGPEKVWFPIKVTEIEYQPDKIKGDNVPTSMPDDWATQITTYSISHVELNPSISKDQFTTKSLGLKATSTIIEVRTDNSTQTLVSRDGVWIPRSIATQPASTITQQKN